MVGHGQRFGRKKEEAIAALLSQRSIEDAARVVGIAVRTLYRWLEIPEFREAYFKARRQAYGQATARLQQASSGRARTRRSGTRHPPSSSWADRTRRNS